MAAILTDVGLVATSLTGMIGDFAGAIVAEPVIMLFVVISVVGVGFGWVTSLIRGV